MCLFLTSFYVLKWISKKYIKNNVSYKLVQKSVNICIKDNKSAHAEMSRLSIFTNPRNYVDISKYKALLQLSHKH